MNTQSWPGAIDDMIKRVLPTAMVTEIKTDSEGNITAIYLETGIARITLVPGDGRIDFVAEPTDENKDNEDIIELLSALEHEQWVSWSRSVAGTEDISSERLERWKKYWVPYSELADDVKEYDREWARNVIKILNTLR